MDEVYKMVAIKGKLANFGHTPYIYNNIMFETAEHHYQWLKAMFFSDTKCAACILASNNPAHAKQLSRSLLQGYDEERWKLVRTTYMHEAVRAKFKYSQIARKLLLSYDINTEFIEFSPWDAFWGVTCTNEKQLSKYKDWPGQNMMGQILMRVRQEIEPIPQPNLFSDYEDDL